MSLLRELFQGELPRLVMFDLDGTLVDSVPDLAAAIDKTLRDLGRPAAGVVQVRNWVGNGARVLVRRALAGGLQHEHVDEALAEQALELFMQHYADNHVLTEVYPGVRQVLDWLREQQVEMAIVTNKPERFIAPLLDALGWQALFDAIVGGDTLAERKPSPAPLLHLAERFGIAPADALMVGDSRTDADAAHAAGMPLLLVRYGYHHGRVPATGDAVAFTDDLRSLLD